MPRLDTKGYRGVRDERSPRTATAGTNTDDVRRRNLSRVLTLVDRRRCVSRTELTRHTGPSRSITKDLVEELIARDLVEESPAPPPSQVGRPSPVVRPTDSLLALSVAREVDAITMGVVSMGGVVREAVRIPNAQVPSPSETVRTADQAIGRIRDGLESTAAGNVTAAAWDAWRPRWSRGGWQDCSPISTDPRRSMAAPRDLVRVVPATLGADTLVIRVAGLAFAPALADPGRC